MRSGKYTAFFALTLVLSSTTLSAQTRAQFLWGEGRPMFTTFPLDPNVQVNAGTIPTWTSSFSFNGRTFPYTMVGTDPAAGSQQTVIPTEIIPLRFVFGEGNVLDPTAPACGGTKSPVQLVVDSPIFQSSSFTP